MAAFWIFWWLVVLLFGARDEHWWPTVRNVGLLAVATSAVAVLTRGRGRLVMLGTRALSIILCFAVGHSLTGQIARSLGVQTIERQLARLDVLLFDGSVTERLQAFNTPALVEWLQANYFLFPALPLPLFFVLLAKRRVEDAGDYASTMALALLVCFAGYIVLPATTPALIFAALGDAAPVRFDGPLTGLWFTDDMQRLLLEATSNRNDAFPSGHTTVTLVALVCAYRMHRRTFWFLLPTSLSIFYATLALRFHFGVDVLAGLCLGVALPWFSRRLTAWWKAEGDDADFEVRTAGRRSA
jgi:membrane-associated phospholipid phosphatase